MFHHDVYQNYPAYLLFSGVWWGWLWFCHCDCCRPYHVLTESEVKIYRWFPSDETAVVYDKDCELCLRWWTLRLFIITAGKWTYVINMSHYERYCGSARSEGVWVSHLFTLPFTTKGCASSGMPSFFFSVCVCVCVSSPCVPWLVLFLAAAQALLCGNRQEHCPPPLHTHTHTTHTPPTHRPCSDSVLTSVLADWSQKDIRSHPISLCLEWVFSDHLWSHFLSSTVGKFDKSNSVTKHKNTTL